MQFCRHRFAVSRFAQAKTPGTDIQRRVPFRKGSDAAEAVNAAFDELKADGTMKALAEKYSLTLAD